MIRTAKIVLMLAIGIACGLIAAPSAAADPLMFSNVVALQNDSATRVDLFSNPGTTLLGPQITFLVDISGSLPPGVTNTLLITYVVAGSAPITQTFQIPALGTIQPPFTQLFTLTSPGVGYQAAMASLTIDIIGSSPDFVIPSGPNAGQGVDSYTYTFNVAQPLPEPATLALFGAGVLGLLRKVSRRGRREGR